MAALPVKEAQCKQMFSSCGNKGRRQRCSHLNPCTARSHSTRHQPSQRSRVPHIVSEGDIGTTGQQHPDHVDVLVLGCPDDGRPAPTVLREEERQE